MRHRFVMMDLMPAQATLNGCVGAEPNGSLCLCNDDADWTTVLTDGRGYFRDKR